MIEKVYAAAAAGDFAGIEALLADDVVLVQCDNHPTPGVCTGKPAVLARLGELFQALRTTGVEVREVVANGPHRVVGIMDALGTDVHGQPYSMPVAELFLVNDGEVTELRPDYHDLVKLRALVGAPS